MQRPKMAKWTGDTLKTLSRNEINFRRYLKRYHPDKYERLIFLENIGL